jgi:hypothetical protein
MKKSARGFLPRKKAPCIPPKEKKEKREKRKKGRRVFFKAIGRFGRLRVFVPLGEALPK